MLTTFDKLSKMLTQEKRLGYKNKAVLGGFEKLAPNWTAEALQEAPNDEVRQVVEEIQQELLGYAAVAEAERPNYIHKILVKLFKVGEQYPSKSPQREAKRETPPPTEPSQVSPPPTSVKHHPTISVPTERERPAIEERRRRPVFSVEPKSVEPKSVESKNDSILPPRRTAPPPRPKIAEPPERLGEETKESKPQIVPPPVPAPIPAPMVSPESYEFINTGLDSAVTRLPGIKGVMAEKLANLGITVIGDFLNLHPRRYDDYRALKPINRLQYGEEVTIIGQIWDVRKRDLSNNRVMIIAALSDGTATIEISWFNQPWLLEKLRPGMQIVVSGKVNEYLGRLNFQSPDWEELDQNLVHTGRIVPVYPLTLGLGAKWLRNQIKRAVDYWTPRLPDPLPEDIRQRLEFGQFGQAVAQVHFPDDWQSLEAARRRLAFDELLLVQLTMLRQRQNWRTQKGTPLAIDETALERLLPALPFPLTAAQQKVLRDLVIDLKQDVPMSRLLQGDVGSGKTVVALLAMILTAMNGGQAAILAPTEILAEQHARSMQKLLPPLSEALGRPFELRLLTGSTPAAERRELADKLASGTVDILVGTHAIIQENVQFKNMQLAVIDEQHRFGVEQRAALRRKGFNPHMLVMTATPIPRTLALTLYGDLDISTIDEMPPGRQPIETRFLTPRERERAYSFIKSQVAQGRQAFIICPLVEESDKLEAKSAVEEHKRLQEDVFQRLKLGLLHGRMKSSEKDQVMVAFRNREIDILVSTSVVEVGIDIPNATVMLVEGANRFGLAQLHQFRGRVGRGEHKSYCLLLADIASPEAEQRLQAVERTTNGFELAEEDLRLRGPGEFFGTRQSGLPDLKFVKLSDTRLLELARREANAILQEDQNLAQPKYRLLLEKLNNFWNTRSEAN